MMTTLKKVWVGPLFQAKKGRRPWVCDFTCPLSGKKKRKRIAEAEANKKKREKAHRDFEHSFTDGRVITKENARFTNAIDNYLKWVDQRHAANDRMSAGSVVRINHAVRQLRRDFGPVLIKDITSQRIQDYIYDKSKIYRTMHFELYQQIRAILQRAVWDDLLLISPLDVKRVRLPQYPKSRTNMPTIELGRAFWHALLHEGRTNKRISSHCNITRMTSTALAMFGGMGAGEQCGLLWEHVNFLEQWIWIEHSFGRYPDKNTGQRLKEPKVTARHRYIPMSREINEWLTKTAQRDGNPRTGYVFRPEPESWNARWGNIEEGHLLRALTGQLQAAQVRLGFVKENGKALWTLHDLRRYAGSVWLELGYGMEQVSEWMGHDKIETTQRYYVRPFKKQSLERGREMMMKVSALHQLLPGEQPALPSPAMRDLCEIDGEVIEE